MTDTPTRFTLRQLPFPAKLVLSCFLIAVGLGYFSALVQLHLQHSSRNGEHLPGPGDVIEVFAGKKKADPSEAGAKPVSKIERLIMGPVEGKPWNGQGSMAAAFFHKDGAGYARRVKENPAVRDEREGERKALQAWLNAPDEDRRKAYDADAYPLPPELVGQPLTADYRANNGGSAKVKSILTDRCARCHSKGEAQEQFPLETYTQVVKYTTLVSADAPVDGWVKSERQISIEKLTQSTHAHLLSFAVLFTLTGLVFAYTDYWSWLRCVLGAGVLIAQVVDIACWWLARIDGVGVVFAAAIIFTGGVVAMGLVAQIVLSLFNMYGPKGKTVVALLLLLGAAILGVVYVQAIAPALKAQREALAVKPEEPAGGGPEVAPMPRPANGGSRKPAAVAVSQLERLIMGPVEGAKWDGGPEGSMAAAFFHRDADNEYKRAVRDDPAVKPKLDAERNGERNAVRAWARADDPARKAAYDADSFPLPPELAGKPITAAYVASDKKAAKVKSILADRCGRCHSAGLEADEYPLETYAQVLNYLGPEK
jgi:hypothetical protein